MNTVQSFAELEKKEVGDKFERTVEIKNFGNSDLKLTSLKTGETVSLDVQSAQYRKDYLGDLGNIYCTYSLSDRLLKRKLLHRVDKRMLLFGTDCLIIHNVSKFFEMIDNKLKNLGVNYIHNLVQYQNFNKNNHKVTYFNKSHIYSYQHEHRLVAFCNTGRPLKIHVGSLKDISDIYSAEEVVGKLTFDQDNGT